MGSTMDPPLIRGCWTKIPARSGTRKNFRRDRKDLSLLPPEDVGHGTSGGWRTVCWTGGEVGLWQILRNQTWEKIQIYEDSPFLSFFFYCLMFHFWTTSFTPACHERQVGGCSVSSKGAHMKSWYHHIIRYHHINFSAAQFQFSSFWGELLLRL